MESLPYSNKLNMVHKVLTNFLLFLDIHLLHHNGNQLYTLLLRNHFHLDDKQDNDYKNLNLSIKVLFKCFVKPSARLSFDFIYFKFMIFFIYQVPNMMIPNVNVFWFRIYWLIFTIIYCCYIVYENCYFFYIYI